MDSRRPPAPPNIFPLLTKLSMARSTSRRNRTVRMSSFFPLHVAHTLPVQGRPSQFSSSQIWVETWEVLAGSGIDLGYRGYSAITIQHTFELVSERGGLLTRNGGASTCVHEQRLACVRNSSICRCAAEEGLTRSGRRRGLVIPTRLAGGRPLRGRRLVVRRHDDEGLPQRCADRKAAANLRRCSRKGIGVEYSG